MSVIRAHPLEVTSPGHSPGPTPSLSDGSNWNARVTPTRAQAPPAGLHVCVPPSGAAGGQVWVRRDRTGLEETVPGLRRSHQAWIWTCWFHPCLGHFCCLTIDRGNTGLAPASPQPWCLGLPNGLPQRPLGPTEETQWMVGPSQNAAQPCVDSGEVGHRSPARAGRGTKTSASPGACSVVFLSEGLEGEEWMESFVGCVQGGLTANVGIPGRPHALGRLDAG